MSKTPICLPIVDNVWIQRCGGEARQSHDGYQLLLGERIFLFYGWNRGSHPPNSDPLSRSEQPSCCWSNFAGQDGYAAGRGLLDALVGRLGIQLHWWASGCAGQKVLTAFAKSANVTSLSFCFYFKKKTWAIFHYFSLQTILSITEVENVSLKKRSSQNGD